MGDIQAVHHVDQATEAETLLAHLPVYLEVKFGSAIWKWFSKTADLKWMTIHMLSMSNA